MGIQHGGRLDEAIAHYGGTRETWLDLSTGINPDAYPVGQVSDGAWSQLPDEAAGSSLLDAAARFYGVSDPSRIVMANGTQAIIERLPELLGFDKVAILTPTYGEHAHVWAKYGSEVLEFSEPESAPHDVPCLVIVNPNNPDCRAWKPDELISLASRHDMLIVDEAFCDAEPDYSVVSRMPENVVVLKSMGKFFGLAGMRLGFAISSVSYAARLQEMMGPWAVSGPALEIGAKALSDSKWIEETRQKLHIQSQRLADLLREADLNVTGINPLFVFAESHNALAIYEHLARREILVRPFDHMPNHLRFGLCRNDAQFARLKEALLEFPDV